jgi:hypothetical protein
VLVEFLKGAGGRAAAIVNTPRIGIIITITREGRFVDKAAAWTQTIAAARGDMYLELLDLRDYPMPFFNEPTSPLWPKLACLEFGTLTASPFSLLGVLGGG